MMNRDSSISGMTDDSQWSSRPLPAVYRFVVSGRVGATWRARLDGMRIDVHESPNGAHTVLEGLIRDRAELAGILNTLNDLHLTLLRAEVVGDES